MKAIYAEVRTGKSRSLRITFDNSSTILIPVCKIPQIRNATLKQQQNLKLIAGGRGINWSDLDVDLRIMGLIRDYVLKDFFEAASKVRHWASGYMGESQLHSNGNDKYEKELLNAFKEYDKALDS